MWINFKGPTNTNECPLHCRYLICKRIDTQTPFFLLSTARCASRPPTQQARPAGTIQSSGHPSAECQCRESVFMNIQAFPALCLATAARIRGQRLRRRLPIHPIRATRGSPAKRLWIGRTGLPVPQLPKVPNSRALSSGSSEAPLYITRFLCRTRTTYYT